MDNIRRKIVDELKTLIKIPSYGRRERDILKYLEKRLEGMGLHVRKQTVTESSYNLICGNSEFLISCHVDTVPPITMRDATTPKEVNGLVYGRGANDVKGQIAYTLISVEEFLKEFGDLPVTLAFVVDEENNSALGSEKLSEIIDDSYKCLVLEPTSGVLCTAQEGALEFTLTSVGKTVHGSIAERFYNPIKGLMDVIFRIEERLNRNVTIFKIRGGYKYYLLPQKCEALLEVKIRRNERWEDIEEAIKDIIKSYPAPLTYKREDAENFVDFRKGELYYILSRSVKEVIKSDPKEGVMPSWTDAVNYHEKGAECIVFGFGNLEDAHTEREHISAEDLERGFFTVTNLLKKVQELKVSGKI